MSAYPPEPSLEEILSSIRRVIAEDDEHDEGGRLASEAASPQEPTMEEILASIRRIIAEDEESGIQSVVLKPPPGLGFLLALVTTSKEREAVLGDAEEAFAKNAQRFGQHRARALYVRDIVGAAVSLFVSFCMRILGLRYVMEKLHLL